MPDYENPKIGQWIVIGDSKAADPVHGLILKIIDSAELEVGYNQNNSKAIAENVIFRDGYWRFKVDAPCGRYLHGEEASAVRKGPA